MAKLGCRIAILLLSLAIVARAQGEYHFIVVFLQQFTLRYTHQDGLQLVAVDFVVVVIMIIWRIFFPILKIS